MKCHIHRNICCCKGIFAWNSMVFVHSILQVVFLECHERPELFVEQMKADEGITAESKARDKMKWVGLMNNLWSSAEEIVIRELIFM